MKLFDYDDSSIKSILAYAKQLEGVTFNQILNAYEQSPIKSYNQTKTYTIKPRSNSFHEPIAYNANKADYKNTNAKGQLGNFLEKYYFGYDPNSVADADFSKVGVELKQTPIDITKKGKYKAGERLSITNISYKEPVVENFYESHVWQKIKCILLVHYIRDKAKERFDYQIKFVNLFSPPKEDLQIIINDYNKINSIIKAGLAHELSEGDTLYLGACTKGKTAKDSMVPQFYGEHILAKKRNFCFKYSYMNYILETYVLQKKVPCETIIKDAIPNDFEQYIINRINKYQGYSLDDLCNQFDKSLIDKEYKSRIINLTFRILGIKSNRAAEFVKANIEVKAIRIEENGKNKESMSFPAFKFKKLIKEQWDTSTLFKTFDETKFLFVVFKKINGAYHLAGAQLWHMPYQDIEVMHQEWEACRKVIKEGIKFKLNTSNGSLKVENNLPNKKDSKMIHIRPHASKAAYKLNNGYESGNILKDGDELPNGEWMTKQSFWLNNDYVLKQLKYK